MNITPEQLHTLWMMANATESIINGPERITLDYHRQCLDNGVDLINELRGYSFTEYLAQESL